MKVLSFVGVILVVLNELVFSQSLTLLPNAATTNLMLTPLINANKIAEAQNMSTVQPFPGFPDVKSYSGFITIDALTNSNFFFWFILSKNNPETAPLLLYMSGGPGSSSMYSVFGETGLFVVTPDQTLEARDCTWNNKYNVIYLDAPIGGGYSYSNGIYYASNDAMVGADVYKFLLQFFKLFSQYKSNDFYVAGESYAGRFVMTTALAIHKDIATNGINLKGVISLSGFLDPPIMMRSEDILYYNGLLSEVEYNYWKAQTDIGMSVINTAPLATTTMVAPLMILGFQGTPFTDFTGYEDYFNTDLSKTPSSLSDFNTFVQTSDFRNRLHIGSLTTFHTGETALPVKIALAADLPSSNKNNVALILKSGLKVLLATGMRDLLANPPAQRKFVTSIPWDGQFEYSIAVRAIWTMSGDTEVTGYVTKVRTLTEVMIRNAGHNIGNDQPCRLDAAVDNFISDQPYTELMLPTIPALVTLSNYTSSSYYQKLIGN